MENPPKPKTQRLASPAAQPAAKPKTQKITAPAAEKPKTQKIVVPAASRPKTQKITAPAGKPKTQRLALPARGRIAPTEDYLEEIEEEIVEEDARPVRKKKSDLALPIVGAVVIILLLIGGVMLNGHRELWDAKMKQMHEVVSTTNDINTMMNALDYLEGIKDFKGMRKAGKHFIDIIKDRVVTGKDADKWKSTVGARVMMFGEHFDNDLRTAVMPWCEVGKEVWVGDKKEFDNTVAEIKAEGYQMEQLVNHEYFKQNIVPMLDLNTYVQLPNEKWSTAEKQKLLAQALHFDWTTIRAIFKEASYVNNQNPTMRMNFEINDETYFIVLWVDFSMQKVGDKWTIKSARLLQPDDFAPPPDWLNKKN